MRIGHYMEGVWDPGGVSGYIRRVAAALRAAGHEVFILDTRPGSRPDPATGEAPIIARDHADLFARALELRLDILHLHCPATVLPDDRVPTVRSLHGHSPYCPSGSRYLARWGRPCDRAYSLIGCLWGHLADHCGSVRPHKTVEEFRRTWTEQRTLPHLLTITASQFLKDQMVRNGYPADRVEALRVPPPPLVEATPPPDGPPRFAYLGRVEANKGVDWLLRAVATAPTRPALDVAGDGTKLPQARALAAELGITDRVTFHGWVAGADAVGLLRSARAMILPSVWHEPGATVGVEAMAAGRAVIMSRVGGMTEIVPGERNGLLVEPNDVAGLAAAIDKLASDHALAARMGAEGRRMVEAEFALPIHLERLTALYERGRELHRRLAPATAR
ncbi:MAG TPA: glycosyltransferase family 4 protein [Gemmataceae bacterium]|nr:glycosyltransferase family 4 protein [Gemmataceae bacterium]